MYYAGATYDLEISNVVLIDLLPTMAREPSPLNKPIFRFILYPKVYVPN